jgi:penicillin-binding protein-related factor A (putative recombinase)
MKPETRFKIKMMGILNQVPGLWFVKTQQMSIRGTPDMILCYRGKFIAFELKREKSASITAMQEYNLDKIRQCGGIGLVVHPENYEEILKVLFDDTP